ncbi:MULTISPECIES: signal peptidase I [Paenibacillus]|uniref:signal peptidase I n=1 Tax=Paenibacillus TaxID=44249 RepID=UPI00168BE727|nr:MULTISPECIES: signal peptidase I [Paenibacillus]
MYKWLKQWVPTVFIAVVLSLLIRNYVAEAMKVPTDSMVPTIQVGDRVLVEKMLWLTTLKFGDLVVFNPPVEHGHTPYVKRLIGLPGDIVEVKDGSLYRNGAQVEEPYLAVTMNYSFGPVTVPENKYFFLGDNRNISYDSHLWPTTPFVDKDEIIGKVILDIPVGRLTR